MQTARILTSIRRVVLNTIKWLLPVYILLCVVLYFFQEKLIFFPEKLDKSYSFQFSGNFREMNIDLPDRSSVNGILFKAADSKGLIFYLHGNAGSLSSWGHVANRYTELNYDVFILDYPGYGKSEGSIKDEEQLYTAVQTSYDSLKSMYSEKNITVLGYSIGTGMAAEIAARNHPKLLILQAPYYNLTYLMKTKYRIVPSFLLKYKFPTDEYITHCTMPVVIFHGNQDGVIDYQSSVKLRSLMKQGDTLITLNGQGHDKITDNPDYVRSLKELLKQ